MLCQKCKMREANVHYTQVINGVKQEMALCSECANESDLKLNLGGFHGIDDFIAGFMSNSYAQNPKISPQKKCNTCGMTLAQLKKYEKLGCEDCYDAFSDELETVFKNVQAGIKHKGRLPDTHSEIYEEEDVLAKLNAALDEAVKKEDYEEAIKLRDEIKRLRGGDK